MGAGLAQVVSSPHVDPVHQLGALAFWILLLSEGGEWWDLLAALMEDPTAFVVLLALGSSSDVNFAAGLHALSVLSWGVFAG